ncbi:MAG TPA: histidine kinase [Burkholderiales bacterium]|nr:histidine kinase [Burkholderiales bacterium]
MSSVLTAPGAIPASRGWFSGFGKRHLGIVLTFCAVFPLTGALFKLAVDPSAHHGAVVGDVIACFVVGMAAMLSVIATENRLAGVLGPVPRMAIAVLAAAIAGTLLMEAVTQLLIRPLGLPIEEAEMGTYAGELHRIAYRFSGAATWSLMLIALYAMFEAKRRASGELHGVRVAALAAERSLVEGDLRAMQARVDPDLLFDTLLAVDRGYAKSVRTGEDALDAVIGFLRAALPADSSATSSVGRELEHVGAYLAVMELLSETKPDVEMSAEPAARAAPMPAMLMLPLVRWALDGRPANRLQVVARRNGAALVISVQSDLGETPASAGGDLGGVRERLMHLYQERGRLDVNADAGRRRAVMEIPL